MLKRLLTVAAIGASALFVWPSCGGDPEEAQKAEVLRYVRTELEGTWKGTLPDNEVVTLTFEVPDELGEVVFHGCASRGGLLPRAFACLAFHEVPVSASIDSTGGTYQGQLEGTATAYGVTGGVNLKLTGATTLYGQAVGPDLSASLGTGSAVTVEFVRK